MSLRPSSRTLAEAFGKQHKDVLESVDNLLKTLTAENSAMLFREARSEHPTVPGRMIRSFEMNRDGFTLLVMGWTGGRPLTIGHLPKRECLILVSGYSVEMRARFTARCRPCCG
jgi:Rha family phage regulatory protein